MKTKVSFYIKESIKYVKDSKLAILTLAIAVGMVAGFGYYFDSAQYYIIQETNYNTFDYVVDFNSQNAHNLNFSFGDHEQYVEKLFLNSNLKIEDSFYYQIYENSRLFLYLSKNKYSRFSWILMENKWFESQRFSNYFEIVKGTIPKNENEIMIDSQFAQKYNISIENSNGVNVQLGIVNKEILNLSNIKVVGFFTPKKELIQFGRIQDIIQSGDNVIFQWANYSQTSINYPNSQLIEHMHDHPEFQNQKNYLFEIDSMIGFTYDRTKIRISRLSATATEINQYFNQFITKLPSDVKTYNLISSSLQNQFQFQEIVRFAIQFTNLPLYLFAVYMGSLANKMKIRKRYHEFFSMRMRGFPKKMVRNQFLMEAIFNSVLISIIGILLGIGIFFLGQKWLNPLFLSQFNVSGFSLGFHFTIKTIIESFLFGALLAIIATFSSIKYINNLKTSDLSRELQNISGDVDYDEMSLFWRKKKRNSSNDEELDIEEFMRKKEELIPKWGIIMAIGSTIPIILFVIMIFGQNVQTSDTIREFSNLLFNKVNLLIILVIISPIFLVVGLIRFLISESPPRFAQISRFLSKIFVKKKGFFVGIEMVRQKQYQHIIFLAGIYVSMLMFSNITINTLIRLEKIKNNIEIGGDINFDFTVSKTSFENLSDVDNFGKSLLNQVDDSGVKRFDDLINVYLSQQFNGRNFRTVFYLNLSDYKDLLKSNRNQNLPSSNFLSELQDVIDFNNQIKNETNKVGLIVSSSFLEINNFQIGETITFLQKSINFTSGDYYIRQISGKIIKAMDVMPGLYYSRTNLPSDFMIVSNHIFQNSDVNIFPSKNLKFIINLNENSRNLLQNVEEAKNIILSASNYSLYNLNFHVYDYNWEKFDYGSLNNSETPYLGLIYFNLIIIGIILAIGMAILVIGIQEQNKKLYGELIARGFGRKGVNLLIFAEISISFFISLIFGMIGGSFSSIIFCRLYSISKGGNIYNFPIYFNILEFFEILILIFSSTFLLLSYTLYRHKKQEISEMLVEIEA